MKAFSLTIFIIFTIDLSYANDPAQVHIKVIQPQNRTVNSGIALINCEHTATATSVEDIQLNAIPLTGRAERTLLCQKGKTDCKNIIMHQENPNKYLFIVHNIGPEAMNMKYECEFTVQKDDVDYTATGRPTILLPGEKESAYVSHPPPPPPPPPLPPLPLSNQLKWIMIGLLALMFLYSCIITSFYIRLRLSNRGPENSTYVVMRKAPLQRNTPSDIFAG